METLEIDIHNCIDAIEYYVTSIEESLIKENAGEREWTDLDKYKDTLENLKFMLSIYGT